MAPRELPGRVLQRRLAGPTGRGLPGHPQPNFGQGPAGIPPRHQLVLQEDDTGDKLTRFAYQTSFASDKNWAGDLTRYSLTTQDKATVQTKLWSAQSILDAMPNGGAGRKIMMAGSGTSGLKEFTWSSLSAAQQRQLNRDPDRNDVADTKGQDRVAFLRGDRSKENSDNFRTRNSILGDIINSSPATVGKAST